MNNGVTVGYPAPVDSSITDKAEEVEASSMSSPQLNAAAAAAAVATGAPTTATSAQPDFSYTSGTGKLVGVVTLTDILGLFATPRVEELTLRLLEIKEEEAQHLLPDHLSIVL